MDLLNGNGNGDIRRSGGWRCSTALKRVWITIGRISWAPRVVVKVTPLDYMLVGVGVTRCNNQIHISPIIGVVPFVKWLQEVGASRGWAKDMANLV